MSTFILSQCWLIPLKPVPKLVLISLADQANDEGVCWPSVASLIRRTGLSDRAVRGALRSLEEVRLLQTSSREGRSNWYTVTPSAYTPAADAGLPEVQATPAPDADPSCTTCSPPLHHVQVEPSSNHQGTVTDPPVARARKKREPAELEAFTLPDWVPADAWEEWLAVRKKIRAPNTVGAMRLNLANLAKLRDRGQDPRAVLEQAIARGWRGLFELKPEYSHGTAHTSGRRESVAERAERINREHDMRERGLL